MILTFYTRFQPMFSQHTFNEWKQNVETKFNGGSMVMLFLWLFLSPLMLIPLIFMGIFFGVCQVKVVKQLGKTCIRFEDYGKYK